MVCMIGNGVKVWQLCFGGDAAKQGGGESAESCACTDGCGKEGGGGSGEGKCK
jgi:hypothetical protein